MKEKVNVSNKSGGTVAYSVPELGVNRSFSPREIKRDISVKELEFLVGRPGGKALLYHYLQVSDPEVLEYLINGEAAPEYWLKEADIPRWMNTCSLDEFKDCLDYAPEGTKDLIKQYAVSMPLNDYSKRQAILEQLGYDVSKALEIKKAAEEPAAGGKPAVTGRRTESSITPPKTERRTESTIQAPIVIK